MAEAGSGAGQVNFPVSVGLDQSVSRLYVSDRFNDRVDEFTASGEFVLAWGFGVVNGAEELQVCTSASECRAGLETVNVQPALQEQLGSFERPGGLAVDPFSGDVWISDEFRVQEFGPSGEPLRSIPGSDFAERGNPLAVDASGDLWVGDFEGVQEFEPSGTHKATVALPGSGTTNALAVTGSGADIYVISSGAAGVREYETATGKQVGAPVDEAGEPLAVALDASGNLFVGGECENPSNNTPACPHPYSIKEYAPSGVQIEQLGGVVGHPGEPEESLGGSAADGIAVDSAGATPALYSASDAFRDSVVQRFSLPAPGPLPEGEAASATTPTSTTLEAALDPENHPTTYRFEYGTEPGVFTHSTSEEALAGSSFAPEPVKAPVAGLSPETTYYFRLTASNHCNEAKPEEVCVAHGEGAIFTTPPAVEIESESVAGVSASAATFEGVLNPQGVPGRWWVEYGTSEGVFDHSTPKEPLSSGTEGMRATVHVQDLEPSTVYHYRFVASDQREGRPFTSVGRALSFTTGPASPSFSLLDGRAWERVTPLDKHGAGLVGNSVEGAINEASVAGDAVSYAATTSTEASPPGEPAGFANVQILSRYGSGGWGSRDIASPHEEEWEPIVGEATEFFAFTPDLSASIVEPKGPTPLGGASERQPYLRRQALCEASPPASECYLPLLTKEDVTSGEKWGGDPSHSLGEVHFSVATPDLSHLVLSSEVPLTPEAKGSVGSVYEWTAGKLELVSVLPGVAGAPAEAAGGIATSADGDRVIWAGSGGAEGGHLYMHEAATHRSLQLDVPSSGATGNEPAQPQYVASSADGSRIFFGDTQQLTVGARANAAAPDLYVYEARADGDPKAGSLRDVTVPVRGGEQGGLLGVAGVSADGAVAYVIADGVLSESPNERGATPQAGQPNLYRIERGEAAGRVIWTPSFIVTLSQADSVDTFPGQQPARVSSSGRWLAFMSELPLTGYDNRDAVTGERDEEAFLYDASTRRLVCASCNPTGARPHGAPDAGEHSLTDPQTIWRGHRIAAQLPDWADRALRAGDYQPRYLSESGRLFFNAMDALVPQDVNSAADVYEFEPAGVGSCSSVSPTYHAGEGGCVDLVSSGISSAESAFLDASESGNDVFFATSGKLVPQDTDTAYDVYDAHVCGSGWECPAPEAVKPPCTNTASCQRAAEPQPSVFGAPPSATFSGTGNHASVVKHRRTLRCRKGRRVKRKDRCVRRHRRRRESGRTHRQGRGK